MQRKLFFQSFATGNVFGPVADEHFRVESQPGSAFEVFHVPLAAAHVRADVVVVAVVRVCRRRSSLVEVLKRFSIGIFLYYWLANSLRTRWVWSTFSSHCPLSSNQRRWLTSATSIILPLNFFWECRVRSKVGFGSCCTSRLFSRTALDHRRL